MKTCECTDEVLCEKAKRLWKYTSNKGRKAYSYHRMNSLGLLDPMGNMTHGVVGIRARNMTPDGIRINITEMQL